MKGILCLFLIQLWFIIGKLSVSANKVLNNYEYWEDKIGSISIDSQASNISTGIKKNSVSYIGENIKLSKLEVPRNQRILLSSISTKPKNHLKTIDFKDNEISEKTLIGTSTSHNNCECKVTNDSCWSRSACIGIASTISVSSLFIFIALMWLVQAFSTYAAKEEHVILKNKLKKQKTYKSDI
ncbi:putative integral membrane protein [Cryptosporidium meleagridis]|uniref:Putative integral membrane protein n=1 Tax=Cryptosporidium meleagridis TaxID=93969 RepID=A0A2P4Z323_9CRYT|nr:putative integral membrane protein [Cryptosporidium meleagridis]